MRDLATIQLCQLMKIIGAQSDLEQKWNGHDSNFKIYLLPRIVDTRVDSDLNILRELVPSPINWLDSGISLGLNGLACETWQYFLINTRQHLALRRLLSEIDVSHLSRARDVLLVCRYLKRQNIALRLDNFIVEAKNLYKSASERDKVFYGYFDKLDTFHFGQDSLSLRSLQSQWFLLKSKIKGDD